MLSLFDEDGDFVADHDLEAGLWTGHGYDCASPFAACDCGGPEFGFSWIDEEDQFHEGFEAYDEDVESWLDYATYIESR